MAKLPTTYPSLLDTGDNFAAVRHFISQMFQRIAVAFNNPDNGATATRPTEQLVVGQVFFDSTLGMPVWWDGAQWVDATGTPA